jgi:hypothetical protein
VNVNKRIPISFQKLNKFEIQDNDTRFLPVKIWLMHLEENLNGSYFSKEVVENALPTLANTPILAYLEENSDGDLDFSDHRQVLVVKNDSFSTKYLGQAIGTIPESNNAQFEERLCDDGITRTFLTVEGLIWTKWDDPIDILNRDLFKSESMELHDDYEGEFNKEDGLFHFSKFKFFGACGLGIDTLPAMKNATIEVNFNLDSFKKDIQEKMEQFKLALSENNDRGGKEMDKETNKEKEQFESKDMPSKDEMDKMMGDTKVDNKDTEDKKDMPLDKDMMSLDKQVKDEFSFTSEQLEDEISRILSQEKCKDDWGWEYSNYWYVDHLPDESIVVAYDCEDGYLVGFNYTINGDVVAVDMESKKRFKIEYVPMQVELDEEDKQEFSFVPSSIYEHYKNEVKENESIKSEFSKLEEEITGLREFKSTKLSEERSNAENEIFDKFSSELTDDDMKPIKDKASEYSLEDLEDKLFALAGRKKVKFSTTPVVKRIKMGLFEEQKDSQVEKDVWTEQKEKFSSNK